MLDQIGERWTMARFLGQSLAQKEEGKKLTRCKKCHARVWAHRLDKTTGECAKWCQRVPVDLGTLGRGRSTKKSGKTTSSEGQQERPLSVGRLLKLREQGNPKRPAEGSRRPRSAGEQTFGRTEAGEGELTARPEKIDAPGRCGLCRNQKQDELVPRRKRGTRRNGPRWTCADKEECFRRTCKEVRDRRILTGKEQITKKRLEQAYEDCLLYTSDADDE